MTRVETPVPTQNAHTPPHQAGHPGRGNFGHGLDIAFVGIRGVDLVALTDPDDAGREAACAGSGAPRGYGSYQEMLATERHDLGARRPYDLDQHEEMVVAAARAGAKAISLKKPIARSLDKADRMLTECGARGVKLTVAHQNRGTPAPRLAQGLITAGKIGRLRRLCAWPKQDSRGGGLDLLVHGTHMFDLIRLFAGDAHWCHARVTCGGRDATAADARPAGYAGGLLAGDDAHPGRRGPAASGKPGAGAGPTGGGGRGSRAALERLRRAPRWK